MCRWSMFNITDLNSLLTRYPNDPYGYYDVWGDRHFCYSEREYNTLLRRVYVNVFVLNGRRS